MDHRQVGVADARAMRGPQAVYRLFDDSLCKMHYDLGADRAPWSVAHFSGVSLHGVDIFDDKGIGGRKVLRNRDDIAANPVDDFLLAIPGSAQINLAQNGRVESCGPGSGILFSTAQAFSSAIVARQPGGQYAQLLARVSGALLRKRVPHVDVLSNLVFCTDAGAGKIVKSMFELGLSEGGLLSSAQAQQYGGMLIDAIANVASAVSAGQARDGECSSRERIRREALVFIDRQLSNPALDVALVAAHCGVSPRYLHLAFAEVSLRLGACVRDARLDRCRAALRDPALRGRSLTDIALQWGYSDPAHFSRAYKTRFGIAPSAERGAR